VCAPFRVRANRAQCLERERGARKHKRRAQDKESSVID
jgi:hypothetical protein